MISCIDECSKFWCNNQGKRRKPICGNIIFSKYVFQMSKKEFSAARHLALDRSQEDLRASKPFLIQDQAWAIKVAGVYVFKVLRDGQTPADLDYKQELAGLLPYKAPAGHAAWLEEHVLPLILWYMFSNIHVFIYLIYQGGWPWYIRLEIIPKEKSYWVSAPWMFQCS